MSTFSFELVSPERLLFSAEVSEVNLPGAEGYMTIMANHAPLMSSIKPGIITVAQANGANERYVVFGGFVDATPSGCTVLAESAILVTELDKEELKSRIAAAQAAASEAKDDASMASTASYLDSLVSLEQMVLPA